MYGAPPSLARYLYTHWRVNELGSEIEIDQFLNSATVKQALIPKHDISLVGRYCALGIDLMIEDPLKHLFSDSKHNYKWQQVFHGMTDTWLDLYHVVDPVVDESKILTHFGAKS